MTAKSSDSTPGIPLPEDFLEDLELFICTRLDHLDPGKESEEYAALDETVRRLIGRVEAALPEDAAPLLSELCEYYTSRAALMTEMYYRQGFADGMRMIVMGCWGGMMSPNPVKSR